jgi:transposase
MWSNSWHRRWSPATVVVLGNLAAHKVTGVRQAIAAAGASILYLPPYSPDLNPIEQLFAKLKALLRKAAARTKDALWQLIGHLLAAVPSSECANYLNHCGHGSIQRENACLMTCVASAAKMGHHLRAAARRWWGGDGSGNCWPSGPS